MSVGVSSLVLKEVNVSGINYYNPALSTVFQRSSRRWSCSVNFDASSNFFLSKPQFIIKQFVNTISFFLPRNKYKQIQIYIGQF